jgi:hypothetical protein
MGGWKQKSDWIQIPPASYVPSLFPFYLNYLSVSLSRVCAPTLPLTNSGSENFEPKTICILV